MEFAKSNWKVIDTEEAYDKALDRLELIFDAVPGTVEFDEVKVLGLLIKDYEDKHYQIPLPGPVEASNSKIKA